MTWIEPVLRELDGAVGAPPQSRAPLDLLVVAHRRRRGLHPCLGRVCIVPSRGLPRTVLREQRRRLPSARPGRFEQH
jgi:hypothetical protein